MHERVSTVNIQPCMLVILLCSLRLSNASLFSYLASVASVLQLLKSGTISLPLFKCVPSLTFFIISRLTVSSVLNAFLLEPQVRLLLTVVHIYKLYLLTYIMSCILKSFSSLTVYLPPVWFRIMTTCFCKNGKKIWLGSGLVFAVGCSG